MVLTAKNELDACAKAIHLSIIKSEELSPVVEFEETFIVSQKGFVGERFPFEITIPEEAVLYADDVLDRYGKLY